MASADSSFADTSASHYAQTLQVFEPVYAWQQTAWQQLTQSAEVGKLPHALLIAGKSGTAKHRFALQLSAWILCQDRQSAHACGSCTSCNWIKVGTHPDILHLIPAADSKSQTIRIDEIRDNLVPFANQRGSGYRIVYVPEATQINLASANALLKLLEEPPERCQFVMVSDSASQLLPTLISRLQRIDAASPSIDQSIAWLESMGKSDALNRLKLSDFSPLKAADLDLQQVMGNLKNALLVWQALRIGQRDPASASVFWAARMSLGEYLAVLDQLLIDTQSLSLALEPVMADLPWERLDPLPAFDAITQIQQFIYDNRRLAKQNIAEQNTLDQLHHLLAQS